MPKATIAEDSDSCSGEDDVGSDARTVQAKEDILAKAKAKPMQVRAKADLWLRIGVPISTHRAPHSLTGRPAHSHRSVWARASC
jgi:hypothetical protein